MSATLLVVEDAAIIRETLVRLLRYEGFTVLAASNGGEALGMMYEQPIDLVLLDILMPRMHGVAFVEALYTDERFRNVPIIGLTGSFDSLQHDRLRTLGVATILPKGKFEMDQLLEVIAEHLTAGFNARAAFPVSSAATCPLNSGNNSPTQPQSI